MLKSVKSGKGSVRLKSSDKSVEEGANRAVEKAKEAKAKAESDAEKVCICFEKNRKTLTKEQPPDTVEICCVVCPRAVGVCAEAPLDVWILNTGLWDVGSHRVPALRWVLFEKNIKRHEKKKNIRLRDETLCDR